jgi:diguanylate cyclase (GGDEF)-like protein
MMVQGGILEFPKARPPKSVPRIAELLAAAMAALVLAGWVFHIPMLTSIGPGLVSMKANTAIAFLLLAGALHCAVSRRNFRRQQGLALAAVLISAAVLLEYILDISLGLDEALFRDPVRSPHPGRMSAITAATFVLLGTAMLLPRFKYSDYLKEALALLAALSSTFAIVGYLYGIPAFYGEVSSSSTAMALHTGVNFLLLAIGFLFVEKETGLVRVFHGPSIASMVARFMVPVSVLVPVVLGALFIRSRWNFSHPHLVMAMSVVADIVLLVVLIWLFAFMIQGVEQERAMVQHQAETDRLTGIYNRRYFETSLEAEVQRARRYGSPLSLVLFDVDGFKQFNDRYGHLTGDRVLKRLVRQCEPSLRGSDVFCRYGGEEFAIIAPETSGPAAAILARRVRESVEGMHLESIPEIVTISVGAAAWEQSFTSSDDLVAAADSALYLAKNSGRNRECLYRKGA